MSEPQAPSSASASDQDPAGQPITALRGVGPQLAERLARLHLATVQDLLFHLPLRYEDRDTVRRLGALRPGESGVVIGRVEHAGIAEGRRKRLIVQISDGTGSADLVFFHFHPGQRQQMRPGTPIRCFGELRPGPTGPQMVHPEYRLGPRASAGDEGPHGLTPVYPTTQGLHQQTLRKLIDQALALARHMPDWLPAELTRELGLPALAEALYYVHKPPVDADTAPLVEGRHPCVQRLAVEELLAHHLSMRRLRAHLQAAADAPTIHGDGRLTRRLLDSLPFALTEAQRRVDRELAEDMTRSVPMLRLVQGDVGSGKTVVAALAALRAVEAGYQAAIMAPTELLAEQHWRSFNEWLAPLDIPVGWVSGRAAGRRREAMLAALAAGDYPVVVGTHALFQDDVRFQALGLVIVDEQHRFGVHQRLALKEKGHRGRSQPHQIIMTATPIPRTLAMTAYADLDVSVIDQLPPGRKPVKTVAVSETRRDEVVARIGAALAQGRQAYWVCTLIEDSEVLEAQAAEETYAALQAALPGHRVGLVHGRMKPADKDTVMADFAAGRIGLLVATTVIEVGVNVPNASLMIIENAERLGLAQLHQLRGRVGRGEAESSCVLMYHGPLSQAARARLEVLRRSNDGFEIARRDLEIRGPGELLGTRQTGELSYRVADLNRDAGLLPRVQVLGDRLQQAHPERVEPLVRRWVGASERYGQV
ncbi:ATP-dependent DNA helicase RecG [Alkalilimnicola ehrlichii MLHE-1]|uniref:ATP-dependent DNA helicase RecG n=1 Tax=Alkalilimnicola ehrlichii (strain ATCC BAA-1101 / DSM 17681 / MLHE-1) TaxID=187272 RepID=Q0A5V7_ALKEH|nr:ATP-dependent DNA helicase RecG [Alkalilimnicola ehrlichii]ABI57780.1 ATP-dependent DNA helicase RecG [Alkalilimnicola ehrlichii MLHE-1]